MKKLLEKGSKLKKWQQRQISTFEYLMYLNSLASRSYKDIAQYHVFPWIFKDYSSAALDLRNEAQYRSLAKTMGAVGSEERVKTYVERYASMDSSSSQNQQPTQLQG